MVQNTCISGRDAPAPGGALGGTSPGDDLTLLLARDFTRGRSCDLDDDANDAGLSICCLASFEQGLGRVGNEQYCCE